MTPGTDDVPRLGPNRRGVYLLPNLFTTAALFGGFYSIISALNGRFIDSSIAIFFAGVMDGLDGRVARWTHTVTEFGKEYDSLSDVVAFGLAPAVVMYRWAFVPDLHESAIVARFGWLAAFFYAVTAALRLARFNTHAPLLDKRYFQGLPSPAAAGLVASFVWLLESWPHGSWIMIPAWIVLVATGALMVSQFRYYSFKDFNLAGRIRYTSAVAIPIFLIVIALSPAKILFVCLLAYAVSGPLFSLWRWRHRRRKAGVAP